MLSNSTFIKSDIKSAEFGIVVLVASFSDTLNLWNSITSQPEIVMPWEFCDENI